MKKISLLVLFCITFLTFAQAQIPPEGFNYSAVARNATGQPIATSTIGIQISILKTSPTGTLQYSENHFVNTDAYGLFNIIVGGGAVQSGSMAAIDWSNDNYYLKVGMDANGGTNFLIMGTTQLLSVPYALHARTAESVTAVGNFTHYIGEQYEGGVIFHLWKDSIGVEHGLICALTEQSTSHVWSNMDSTEIGTLAQSSWNGFSNSNAIVNEAGHTSSAAKLCIDYVSGGQNDWYLPSIDELILLWNNRFNVNKTLSEISGAIVLQFQLGTNYWSSTECGGVNGVAMSFGWNTFYFRGKQDSISVRAIRAF